MIDQSNYNQLWNRQVVDTNGDKIGDVEQIFTDESGQPQWVTVNTGLFGMKQSFIPLADAELRGDGALFVPVTKDEVNGAPRIDTDSDTPLSADEERELYQHYNQPYSDWQGQGTGSIMTEERGQTGGASLRLRRYLVEHDTGTGTVRTETHTQEERGQRGTN